MNMPLSSKETFDPNSNVECQLYPSIKDQDLIISRLLSVNKRVAIVGIISQSFDVSIRFANELSGFLYFSNVKNINPEACSLTSTSIRMYYDDIKSIVYMIGFSNNKVLYNDKKNLKYTEKIAEFNRQKNQMLLFFLSTCHLLYTIQEPTDMTPFYIKNIRNISKAKNKLAQFIIDKRILKEKYHYSQFSPGKLITHIIYVYPISENIQDLLKKNNINNILHEKDTELMDNYQKNLEYQLRVLTKPLRNTIISTLKMKEFIYNPPSGYPNTNKNNYITEYKLFNIDIEKSVILLTSSIGRPGNGDVLSQMLQEILSDKVDNIYDNYNENPDDTSIPINEIGMKTAILILDKFVDLLFTKGGKNSLNNNEKSDKTTIKQKNELLTLSQWLRTTLTIGQVIYSYEDVRTRFLWEYNHAFSIPPRIHSNCLDIVDLLNS